MRILKKGKQARDIQNKVKPSEIIVDFELDVNIPEFPITKARGKIDIPEAKVKEILIDSFEGDED